MRPIVIISFLLLALPPTTAAQTTPDFSGTWRMDPARSESAVQGLKIAPATVTITQTPDAIRFDTTTPQGVSTETYRLRRDGDAAGVSTDPVAQWRGDTLVSEAVRNINGVSVTLQQSRTLSVDRNEMTVVTVVNVQHGYSVAGAKVSGAGTDVYVRVTPRATP